MDSTFRGDAPAQMAPAPLFAATAPQYPNNPQQQPAAPQYSNDSSNHYEYPLEKTPFAMEEAPHYNTDASLPPQTTAPQYTPGNFRPQGTMCSQYVGGGLRPRGTGSQSGNSRTQAAPVQGLSFPPPLSLRGADGQGQDGFHSRGPSSLSRAPTWEEPRRNQNPYPYPHRAHSTSSSISERKPWGGDEKRQYAFPPPTEDSDLENLVDKRQLGAPGSNVTAAPDAPRPIIPLRHRIKHFTWAWYTWTMGTGGLALLIISQPFTFPGLRTIGLILYIFNLALFATISCIMISRFIMYPGTFLRSIKHKKEGFFFPTIFVSISTMISGSHRYLIPENDATFNLVIQVVFWVYVTISMTATIGQYSYVFSTHQFGLQTMMPAWLLPVLPIMLAGTISAVISATQPSIAATPIVVGGLLSQGLGMIISLLMYGHMIGRLMSGTFPDRETRPALFILVGPPSFTSLAFIGQANNLPADFDIRLGANPILPGQPGLGEKAVIQILAYVSGTLLWGLALWWFTIALTGVVRAPPRYFHLSWWGMIFPNTGFALATITLGKSFANESIQWLGTVMSILVTLLYIVILYNCFWAVVRREIVYPGRDEDTDD